jgi:hypothetical protein
LSFRKSTTSTRRPVEAISPRRTSSRCFAEPVRRVNEHHSATIWRRSSDVGPERIKSPKLASSLYLEASSIRRATKRIERSSPNCPDGHTTSGRERRHIPAERVVMCKSNGMCVFLPSWMCRSHTPLQSTHRIIGPRRPKIFHITASQRYQCSNSPA